LSGSWGSCQTGIDPDALAPRRHSAGSGGVDERDDGRSQREIVTADVVDEDVVAPAQRNHWKRSIMMDAPRSARCVIHGS
jgi:hypothetical protein